MVRLDVGEICALEKRAMEGGGSTRDSVRTNLRTLEVRPHEDGMGKVGPVENRFAEIGPAQVGTREIGAGHGCALGLGLSSIKIRIAQIHTAQVGAFEAGVLQIRPREGGGPLALPRLQQLGGFQVGPFKIGIAQIGPAQVGGFQGRLLQADPTKIGSDRFRTNRVAPGVGGTAHVGTVKDGPGQAGDAAQQCTGEIYWIRYGRECKWCTAGIVDDRGPGQIEIAPERYRKCRHIQCGLAHIQPAREILSENRIIIKGCRGDVRATQIRAVQHRVDKAGVGQGGLRENCLI